MKKKRTSSKTISNRYFKAVKQLESAINKEKDEELIRFCVENNIVMSQSGGSFYFAIGEQKYRVSDHSVEFSNIQRKRARQRPYHKKHGNPSEIQIRIQNRYEIYEVYKKIIKETSSADGSK